jgi:hypothetical protein
MGRWLAYAGGCIGGLILAGALFLGMTWLFLAGWNWIAVGVFHWPALTFWQMAFALFLLSLLTGGSGARIARARE